MTVVIIMTTCISFAFFIRRCLRRRIPPTTLVLRYPNLLEARDDQKYLLLSVPPAELKLLLVVVSLLHHFVGYDKQKLQFSWRDREQLVFLDISSFEEVRIPKDQIEAHENLKEGEVVKVLRCQGVFLGMEYATANDL